MFLLSLKHKPWDNSSKPGLFPAVEFCMRCRLFMLTLQSFPWGVHQLGSFYPRPLPPLLGMQTYWCFITFGAEQKASCPNTTLLRATGWTESVLELLKLAAHRFWFKGWWPRGVVWAGKKGFYIVTERFHCPGVPSISGHNRPFLGGGTLPLAEKPDTWPK